MRILSTLLLLLPACSKAETLSPKARVETKPMETAISVEIYEAGLYDEGSYLSGVIYLDAESNHNRPLTVRAWVQRNGKRDDSWLEPIQEASFEEFEFDLEPGSGTRAASMSLGAPVLFHANAKPAAPEDFIDLVMELDFGDGETIRYSERAIYWLGDRVPSADDHDSEASIMGRRGAEFEHRFTSADLRPQTD